MILLMQTANHSLIQARKDGDCQARKNILTFLPVRSHGITATRDAPMKATGFLLLAIVVLTMAVCTLLVYSVTVGVYLHTVTMTVTY